MILRVFSMARPSRPASERALVVEAASASGTAVERATRLAKAVAAIALDEIDREDAERVIGLLRQLAPTAVDQLATAPEFATAEMIVRQRVRRLEARGGKRLSQPQWADEDREVLKAVVATLSRRYRTYLSGGCRKLP